MIRLSSLSIGVVLGVSFIVGATTAQVEAQSVLPSAQEVATDVAQGKFDPSKILVKQVQGLLNLGFNQLPGLDRTQLSALTGINDLALGNFPGLKDTALQQLPSLQKYLGLPSITGTETLTSLIQGGDVSKAVLDKAIGSVPGLSNATLGSISGIQGLPLSNIPGFGQTPVAALNLSCFTPQFVGEVNYDRGGFTEFSAPAQRFMVGQEVQCGNLKIIHRSVDENTDHGKFASQLFVCAFGVCAWTPDLPWPDAVVNQVWLGPPGNHSTSDSDIANGLVASIPKPFDPTKPIADAKPGTTSTQPAAGNSGSGTAKQNAIANTAKASVGKLSTANIPGTQNGNVGCAAAVNEIVKQSTGKPVGGGLSTAAMDAALQSGRGTAISSATAKAGDIIISPTKSFDSTTGGSVTGHVGICLTDGCTSIGSNSSSSGGIFKQNFSLGSWNSTFQNKGLSVKFYKLN
jgi:hypothetical protein